MRKFKRVWPALAALLVAVCTGGAAQEYNKANFYVKVKNYASKPVVLGYYFNGKMLVRDTVQTDARGVAHFDNHQHADSAYQGGLYILHFPDNGAVMDMMMPEEQSFTLECDTVRLHQSERVTVKGSPALQNFFAYQRYIVQRQRETAEMAEQFRNAGDDEALKERIRKRFAEEDSVVKQHTAEVLEANKDNFLGVFLRALQEVKIPKFDVPESYTPQQADSLRRLKSYYYYRAHFYDNFDMHDPRLLRTPFFAQKIDTYFKESVPQLPDTVADEAIRLIEMCRGNKEMFRFFVSTMYNYTNQSNIMGMDAAMVRLADKYYLSGEADWSEKKFLEDLRENVEGIRYTLIGLKAPDMKLVSPDGEWFRLSEVKAPYTVLVFWEPSCGHCKKEVPHLKTAIYDKYAKYGVKVFAVYAQVEKQPWVDFIEEHQLEEFINVYDPYGQSGFRRFYNIKSTPTIFVLDKGKTIVAKRLGVEQIDDYLAHMLGLPAPEHPEEAKKGDAAEAH